MDQGIGYQGGTERYLLAISMSHSLQRYILMNATPTRDSVLSKTVIFTQYTDLSLVHEMESLCGTGTLFITRRGVGHNKIRSYRIDQLLYEAVAQAYWDSSDTEKVQVSKNKIRFIRAMLLHDLIGSLRDGSDIQFRPNPRFRATIKESSPGEYTGTIQFPDEKPLTFHLSKRTVILLRRSIDEKYSSIAGLIFEFEGEGVAKISYIAT